MILILNVLLAPIVAFIIAGFYYGFYRRFTARIHRRWGPPIYQNFADNIKLYSKVEAASHGLMFHLGPVIMAAGSVTSLLFIPFFNNSVWFSGVSEYGNLILITYLMVVGPLGNALSVGAGGNPFGVMGVVRGLTRLIGLEIGMYIAIGLLMAVSGTTSLTKIISFQVESGTWNMVEHPLIFIISLFSFVGFMGASPFDVVGAPTEVYSGPVAEFGSKYLGILMSQRLMFSFAKLLLWVNLFLGGASNILELLGKTFALFLFEISIGSVFPRFKVEQAVDFLWKIPALLGLLAGVLMFFNGGVV
ncbi:NADH-quinone oxidoreductase subunit H [Thiospirochaeta perfilievii]|uniref:NADH-quinone oxidoreductase subunit H n=1 Tax=Thiospirochaeta perfilievii TaxID=252967 RepID=A0A5C1QG68_9SPIO|nr:NADH-quinone oxidoreductase subunit H [Thiospirochaeta perfilievii]